MKSDGSYSSPSLSIPVGLRSAQGKEGDAWGRILGVSVDNVQVETRSSLKVGQVVYLTFAPQGNLKVENLRARVVDVKWEDGYYVAELFFDDSVDKSYLREALVIIMNK